VRVRGAQDHDVEWLGGDVPRPAACCFPLKLAETVRERPSQRLR